MVLVVGAGIVGVSQAFSLARRGLKVVLIDPKGVGAVTSWGNSGFLCPSLAQPVAPMKVLTSDWKYRFPFPTNTIDPYSSLVPVGWFGRFLSEQKNHQHNLNQLEALADLSQEFYQQHIGRPRGGLHLFRNSKEPLFSQDDGGLTGQEILECDPSLSWSKSVIPFGRFVETDSYVEPTGFINRLSSQCRELGVDIRREKLQSLDIRDGVVTMAQTDKHTYYPDSVVISVGHETSSLLQELHLADYTRSLPPLLPCIGYSLTVSIDWDRVKSSSKKTSTPQLPLYAISDLDRMCTFLPMSPNQIRVAAFLDFYDTNTYPDLVNQRYHQIRSYLLDLFPWLDYQDPEREKFWIGTRLLTPSSLPIYRSLDGVDNLYLNTGHGRLGMTLGPATSELLAREISSKQPTV